MGYAGGTRKNPTYHALGDHSETVQVDFNPRQISYEELLSVFWASHSPELPPYSRQYMSLILYHNEEQKRLAAASRVQEQIARKRRLYTEIVPLFVFYPAEGYHQKYYLRREPELMREFRAMYPDDEDFINSTAAARVNGYIAGYGTQDNLEAELESLGLSETGKARLLELVPARHRERVRV